jgi:hypothetical protein
MVRYNAAMVIEIPLLHDNTRDLVARRDLAGLSVTLGPFYEPSDPKRAADYYRKDLGIWTGGTLWLSPAASTAGAEPALYAILLVATCPAELIQQLRTKTVYQ